MQRPGDHVGRVQLGDRAGDPRVPPHAPQLRGAGVERLPHEQVGEAHRPRRGFDEQLADHAGLERVQHGVLVQLGSVYEHRDLDVAADHRGQPQYRHRRLGEAGEPAAQDVSDAVGYPRQRSSVALAGQQPCRLLQVERVAVGPGGEHPRRVVVRTPAGDRGQHVADLAFGQAGQHHPRRPVGGDGGQQVVEARLGLGTEREHEHHACGRRRVEQPPQQRTGLGVGAVDVVEHDRHRSIGVRAEVAGRGAVQPEPIDHRIDGAAGNGVVGQQSVQALGPDAGVELGGQCAEHLHPGPGGPPGLVLGAAADGHPPSLRDQPPAQVGQQRGLAAARLAGDERDARIARPAGRRPHLQRAQRVRTTDEDPRRTRGRRGRGLRSRTGRRRRYHRCNRRHRRHDNYGMRGPDEVDRLVEHVLLELAQPRTGIEPELVAEHASSAAQRGERLALPSGRVLREGQQSPALLAQRMVAHELPGVQARLDVLSRAQARVGQPFERDQPQLLQPPGLGRGPLLRAELGQGVPAPEREGTLERGDVV